MVLGRSAVGPSPSRRIAAGPSRRRHPPLFAISTYTSIKGTGSRSFLG